MACPAHSSHGLLSASHSFGSVTGRFRFSFFRIISNEVCVTIPHRIWQWLHLHLLMKKNKKNIWESNY